jgi:hypothetical protein
MRQPKTAPCTVPDPVVPESFTFTQAFVPWTHQNPPVVFVAAFEPDIVVS